MSLFDHVRGAAETVRGVLTDPEEREEFKEKVKDLPLYALQTALSGVGHALLIADRCRTALRQLTGASEEEARPGEPEAGERPQRRRAPVMYSSEPNGDRVRPPAADEEHVARPPIIYSPATESKPKDKKPEPPLPNYEELTIPSLRARLRGLTAEQVAELRDYEKATLNRDEVVRMYENRLVKLANMPKPRE